VVVAATHLALGEGVAVKLLQRTSQSAENLLRFEREARALARVKSDHVARVMDTGSLATGEPYLVMELLDGDDFGVVMKREGKLETAVAVDYVLQACEAVVQAHARGIVHRDLKPANLFLSKGPSGASRVKVLDFGISKLKSDVGVEAQAVTQTLSVIGSPLYMSPEQMQTPRDADELSDVWSLAVIFHEMVTGKAPFEASTLPLLCAKICTAPPTRLTEVLPDAPHALEAIVLRALDKDKAKRQPSVAALALALAPFGTRASDALAEQIAKIADAEKMPLDVAADVSPDSIGRRLSWSSSPPPAADPSPQAHSAASLASRPRQPQFRLAIGIIAFGLVCLLVGAVWGQRSVAPANVTASRGLGLLAVQGGAVAVATDALDVPAATAKPDDQEALARVDSAAPTIDRAAASSISAPSDQTTRAPGAVRRASAPSSGVNARPTRTPSRAPAGDVFSER